MPVQYFTCRETECEDVELWFEDLNRVILTWFGYTSNGVRYIEYRYTPGRNEESNPAY